MRFQTKLMLYFVLLLATIQFCSIYAVYWQTSHYMIKQLEQQINNTAKRLNSQLDDIHQTFDKKASLLLSTSQFLQILSNNNRGKLNSLLLTFKNDTQADRMLVIDSNFQIFYDTNSSQNIAKTFPFSHLLSQAHKKEVRATFALDNKIYLWMIKPLHTPDNPYWLAVGKEIAPLLQKDLDLFSAIPATTLFAYQAFNQPWQYTADIQNKNFQEDLLPFLEKPQKEPYLLKEKFVFKLPISKLKNGQGVALLIYSQKNILAAYHPLIYGLILITLGGLLLLVLGSILIARKLTKPLHHMAKAITRIEQGDYSHPIPLSGADEIGQLAIIFNQMMQGIETREKALFHQSRHDPVTTLPNRIYFLEYLEETLKEKHSPPIPMAIVSMGIERFPQINHILGHHIGDRLLHHVAARLSALSEAAIVSRLANNIFIAVFPHFDATNFASVAERIIKSFETPFSVYTVNIDLDVQLGASFYPTDGEDPNLLMQKADVALFAARRSPERFAYYQQEKDPQLFNKLSLMSELREGLIQNELEVYYQPKVSIPLGQVVHVESLIRWQHPTKGFMPPEQFIPLAEETGHIKKITFWLIEKVVEQCSLWHKQNIPLGVSVNLSVKDLLNKKLVEHVGSVLKEYGTDPALITFEIVESAFMMDPDNALQAIRNLKELGVHFSIDDFGTGYSSLSYLKQLPVNELKIDQSFVKEITRSPRVASIVQSTIELGHSIETVIVAEGLSDKATFDMLKSFGCDLGQGFLFSQPLSLKELTHWLQSSPWGLPLVRNNSQP